MIKKVIVGVLLAGIFGLLVFGAVNRTLAKSDESSPIALTEGRSDGSGRGTENNDSNGYINGNENDTRKNQYNFSDDCTEDCESVGLGRNQNDPSRTGNNASNQPLDGSGYRNGIGNTESSIAEGQGKRPEDAPSDGLGTGQAVIDVWITKTGIVEEVTSDIWEISLSDGITLDIEGRALQYLTEVDFSVAIGDSVIVTGFYEGDKFEVGQIEDTTSGESVLIREENGRPLWAGGGRSGVSRGGNYK